MLEQRSPANENHDPPNYWSLYRWHVMDPICFDRDLKVTIQALGWGGDRQVQATFGQYRLRRLLVSDGTPRHVSRPASA